MTDNMRDTLGLAVTLFLYWFAVMISIGLFLLLSTWLCGVILGHPLVLEG